MLVLSRKIDQKIIIGGNVSVMVIDLDLKRQSVRLGIEAPQDIAVDREEIHLAKTATKEAANDSAKPI